VDVYQEEKCVLDTEARTGVGSLVVRGDLVDSPKVHFVAAQLGIGPVEHHRMAGRTNWEKWRAGEFLADAHEALGVLHRHGEVYLPGGRSLTDGV